METQKIKRYRLSVSRVFPATHFKKGESTYFIPRIESTLGILNGCEPKVCLPFISSCSGCYYRLPESEIFNKLHTIRSNYDLWDRRMYEVHEGKAVIELFYWNGKPYGKGVKQVVFATLDKDSGCGVQKLDSVVWQYAMIKRTDKITISVEIEDVAKNDGLSLEDFAAWFKGSDLSKPLAIIQFTDFRY